jgi:hypothetical protein
MSLLVPGSFGPVAGKSPTVPAWAKDKSLVIINRCSLHDGMAKGFKQTGLTSNLRNLRNLWILP